MSTNIENRINNNKHNYLIDLTRIILMIFIVLHHMMQIDGIVLYNCSLIDFIIFVIKNCFGNFSNCLFICISAHYLINNNTVNIRKVIYLIICDYLFCFLDVLISIVQSKNFTQIRGGGISLLFPLFDNRYFWYIHAYIIYYLLHGYLNKLLSILSIVEYKIIVVIIILHYSIIPMIIHVLFPSSIITGFIFIHILVFYFNKFKINKSIKKIGYIYLFIVVLSYIFDSVLNVRYFTKTVNVDNTMFYNLFLILFCLNILDYVMNCNIPHGVSRFSLKDINKMCFVTYYLHFGRKYHYFRDILYNISFTTNNQSINVLKYISFSLLYFVISFTISIVFVKYIDDLVIRISSYVTINLYKMKNKYIEFKNF